MTAPSLRRGTSAAPSAGQRHGAVRSAGWPGSAVRSGMWPTLHDRAHATRARVPLPRRDRIAAANAAIARRSSARSATTRNDRPRRIGDIPPRRSLSRLHARDDVEDRLDVGRRRSDHAAGSRRSRSAAPAPRSGRGCAAQLLEQAGVLDRDHSLIGERLQQRDLLLGERPNLDRCMTQHAERLAVRRSGRSTRVRWPELACAPRDPGYSRPTARPGRERGSFAARRAPGRIITRADAPRSECRCRLDLRVRPTSPSARADW